MMAADSTAEIPVVTSVEVTDDGGDGDRQVDGHRDVTELRVSTSPEFDGFYRQSYRGVARALAYTLGDVELAREATDEAMARAFARWSDVSGYDNPGGWVYRVGLNWARSFHRRAARKLPLRAVAEVEQPPVPDPRVRAALMELDLRLRSVVVCRLLLDWSIEETARALDISKGTAKSRLHRALRQLESKLSHLKVTR